MASLKLENLYLEFHEWTFSYKQNNELILPKSLKSLVLDFSNCIVIGESECEVVDALAESLQSVPELEKLSLSLGKWSELTDHEIINLSTSIKGLTSLVEFSFNISPENKEEPPSLLMQPS